jgi:hypothetical protein
MFHCRMANRTRRQPIAAGVLFFAVACATVSQAQVQYNSIPNPLPTNVASEGPEAYGFAELGDGLILTGPAGQLLKSVQVTMSDWACQSGQWNLHNCVTTPGATFKQDITIKVYSVIGATTPGPLLGALTRNFDVPYRPTSTPAQCAGDDSVWFSAADSACYHGLAFPISIDFSSLNIQLGQRIIVTVAYNTTSWGPSPLGAGTACFGTPTGCPYDALNISTDTTSGAFSFIGAPIDPNGIYVNYSIPANSCTGAITTGSLQLDTGCWVGYHPQIRVVTSPPPVPLDGTFQLRYFSNLQAGESYINVINTGYNGNALNGPGFGAGNIGNVCVNVYAMAQDEQLVACCSCMVTPNQVVNLGVNRDLATKTLTGIQEPQLTVKLIASLPTAGSCANSAATLPSNGVVGGFVAFGTTLHSSPTVGAFETTEAPFVSASLVTNGGPAANDELHSLSGRCASILGNGSGYGVCSSCQQGALGASKR